MSPALNTNKIRGSWVEADVCERLLRGESHDSIIERLGQEGFKVSRKTFSNYVNDYFNSARNTAVQAIRKEAEGRVAVDVRVKGRVYGDFTRRINELNAFIAKQQAKIDEYEQTKEEQRNWEIEQRAARQADPNAAPDTLVPPAPILLLTLGVDKHIMQVQATIEEARDKISEMMDGPDGLKAVRETAIADATQVVTEVMFKFVPIARRQEVIAQIKERLSHLTV